MKAQASQLDFAVQDIYIGIDVHLSSWTVSIYSAHLEHKTFRQDPCPETLIRYLQRHFPGARCTLPRFLAHLKLESSV